MNFGKHRFPSQLQKSVWIRILPLMLLCSTAFAVHIDQVLDGGGNRPDLAPGSVFIVKGAPLTPNLGLVQAQAPDYPTELNSVSIAFQPEAGGDPIAALMVYTYADEHVQQLAGVLPSTTAAGTYQVTVTVNGEQSDAFTTHVIPRKPGIVTANSAGTGPAQATIGGGLVLQRYVNAGTLGAYELRPIHPGERVDLWGTGLGADVASDTGGSSGDQTQAGEIRVFVNGEVVVPLYAGRSQGYPGLDQIAFNMPSYLAVSCTVRVQVRAGGVYSNPVTVATSNGEACTGSGLSQSQLETLSKGGTIEAGLFELRVVALGGPASFGPPSGPLPANPAFQESSSGGFLQASIGEPRIEELFFPPSGGCIVLNRRNSLDVYLPGRMGGSQDAGGSLTLMTPGSQSHSFQHQYDGYQYGDADNFAATRSLGPGMYTLSGQGGADIGAFSANLTMPEFSWTNADGRDTVNRSQPLTINWTGGGDGMVTVWGFSGSADSGNIDGGVMTAVYFACTAPASDGSLTLSADLLSMLPKSTIVPADFLANDNPFQAGALAVTLHSKPSDGAFTAPLTGGGNTGIGEFFYNYTRAQFLNYQ